MEWKDWFLFWIVVVALMGAAAASRTANGAVEEGQCRVLMEPNEIKYNWWIQPEAWILRNFNRAECPLKGGMESESK